jgi:galactose mutarotase-like enzyme
VNDGMLTLRTTLEPSGPVAVPVAFGFHPYLRLPGVPRRRWRVALPALRRLELDARGLPTGSSSPQAAWSGALGDRVFDDAFAAARPGSAFGLAGGGRSITVRFGEGYAFAQLYAPADDDVVCFEPMTAPTNALITGDGLTVVGPGDAYRAAFSVTVDRDVA